MVVMMFYILCIVIIGVIRVESNWKWVLFIIVYMIVVVFIVGILIWYVGIVLGFFLIFIFSFWSCSLVR